ncbi:MAG TPA: YdcF family protein [Spirochaetota bacterium]|nr:YdcF family protein [Spirochaetota bacterium]
MKIVAKLIKRIKQIVVALLLLLFAALIFFTYTVYTVYSYPRDKAVIKTDAVIVLGAAAWGKNPSPVFKERINHAIRLYDAGMCRYIIFTGGKGGEDEPGESVIARRYAIKNGVNEKFILIENKSRTTEENIFYAGKIAEKYGLKTFTLVSDPYHLKRAAVIAEFHGMTVYPSATPTTRFKGSEKKLEFLIRESYYLILYKIGIALM